MGYTTNELCKLCNVGRETLRHYEQLGLLQPEVNPENRYRSYDGWDASVIADIKRYQSLGFSLEQIKSILSEYDLAKLIASVADRVAIYRDQIRYYQMLCQKSEEESDILQRIPQLLGRYTISQLPSLLYLSDKDLTRLSFANRAMKHLDFFVPCLGVDHDFAGDETKSDYSGWGLLAKKDYADYFDIHDGIIIPEAKAVCTIIDVGEKGNITKALFEPFYSHIRRNGLQPIIYSCLLARTHDSEGGYHRYLYTFCTINDRPLC